MERSANLRRRIIESVREMVIRQEIDPARSVGEVALSRRLGVSRTPVREALFELEREGLVHSRRGQGFMVTPLSAREAADTYPVIWSLERLALQQAGQISVQTLNELQALNRELEMAETAYDRVNLDSRWHARLISDCSNRRLNAIVEDLKQVIRRYEFAYLRSTDLKDKSTLEHDYIVTLLREDLDAAGDALENHWRDGMSKVIAMLGQKGAVEAAPWADKVEEPDDDKDRESSFTWWIG